jgi:hypothetical protein
LVVSNRLEKAQVAFAPTCFAINTVIRFVSTRAKFGICTVESLNGTLVEDEMRTCYSECEHFRLQQVSR